MAHLAYPVTAIRDDGFTMVATTPEEARDFNRLRIGDKHVEMSRHEWDGSTHYTYYRWILRDVYGDAVDPGDLPQPIRRRPWWTTRSEAARAAAERGLPIPGTSGRRSYRWSWRSFDMNIAARAADAALDDDLAEWGVEEFKAGRRRHRKLPQVWDDVSHRHYDRNWKRSRRTRWKAGAA